MPVIATYGTTDIQLAELRRFDLTVPYNINTQDKLSGDSIVTKFNKQPPTLTLGLIYNVEYSIIDPMDAVNVWEAIADTGNLNVLIVGNKNYGTYIIKEIRVTEVRLVPKRCSLELRLVKANAPVVVV